MLLHGIMSSIAEFYSLNLSNEVKKGMGEKARNGGCIGRAPLGYRNITGDYTLKSLAAELNSRGLIITEAMPKQITYQYFVCLGQALQETP